MNDIVSDQATIAVYLKERQSRSVSNTVVILSSKMGLTCPLLPRSASVKARSRRGGASLRRDNIKPEPTQLTLPQYIVQKFTGRFI